MKTIKKIISLKNSLLGIILCLSMNNNASSEMLSITGSINNFVDENIMSRSALTALFVPNKNWKETLKNKLVGTILLPLAAIEFTSNYILPSYNILPKCTFYLKQRKKTHFVASYDREICHYAQTLKANYFIATASVTIGKVLGNDAYICNLLEISANSEY